MQCVLLPWNACTAHLACPMASRTARRVCLTSERALSLPPSLSLSLYLSGCSLCGCSGHELDDGRVHVYRVSARHGPVQAYLIAVPGSRLVGLRDGDGAHTAPCESVVDDVHSRRWLSLLSLLSPLRARALSLAPAHYLVAILPWQAVHSPVCWMHFLSAALTSAESQDTLIKKAALDKFMLQRKRETTEWDITTRLSPVPAHELSSRWAAVRRFEVAQTPQ